MDNKIVEQLTSNTQHMLDVEHKILEATVKFRKELNDYQEKDRELRAALQEAMEKSGVKSYENKLLKIAYIDQTTRKGVDVKRMEAEDPKLFEKYRKDTKVKANVRITVNTVTLRIK